MVSARQEIYFQDALSILFSLLYVPSIDAMLDFSLHAYLNVSHL